MQKTQLHLWFDKEAGEALAFYTTLFPDSAIRFQSVIHNTPSGDCDVYQFTLAGLSFQALNGGPAFQINASVSLSVMCETADEVDALHQALVKGGSELMPLGEYPFCKRYAWVKDRFGLTWQLMLTDTPITQKIIPTLLFSGSQSGRAEDAIRQYADLLPGSSVDFVSHYKEGEAHNPAARVNYALFTLADTVYAAMDNGTFDEEPFSEAVSIIVNCGGQAEIDRLWEALSQVPEAEACGWLKDSHGLSWQIVPEDFDSLALDKQGEYDPGVMQAVMDMKKLDIEELRRARPNK